MIREEFVTSLLDFSKNIGAVGNLEHLGQFIVDKSCEIFHAKKVSSMLLDKDTNELSMWASSDKKEELKKVKIEFGKMFSGWVAKEGRPLLVKNVDSEYAQFSKSRLGRYDTKSFIIAPIKSEDKTYGVINITDKKDADNFTQEDLDIINLINPLVAMQMEKVKLLEEINSLVVIDNLTELLNHRSFQEHLSEDVERAQRYRRPLSLIMLDIDNFRDYNENYGYAMGDCVLKQTGVILRENLRKVDIIARYAGERFAVLMSDTDKKHAAVAAEKVRDKVASAVFVEKRTSSLTMTRLTVSIGVAEYNIKTGKEDFLKQAEEALLEAKREGKNRVCLK